MLKGSKNYCMNFSMSSKEKRCSSIEILLTEFQNIAVVCHDAGAANIIIHAISESGRKDWQVFLEGPARKIWQELSPEIILSERLESCLKGASALISGTGWASNIEHNARKRAKETGIYSIAVIDHWVNYEERFVRDNEIVLPDEIWVTDHYAYEIAHQAFPENKICIVPNYYIKSILLEISATESPLIPEFLYIAEPTRDHWGRHTPGEHQALKYFLEHLACLSLPSEMIIRLRPHPSEKPSKYDNYIGSYYNIELEIDHSRNLSESIGRASWLAGCESFALVLGILSGRTCYCSLPPNAPCCRLPYNELVLISSLIEP